MRFIRCRWWLLLLPALALGWWLHARQGAGADIVFVSNRHVWSEIYRMHGDGTGVRRLVAARPNTHCVQSSVSPDGKRLVYAQLDAARGEEQIWVAEADGANPRQVTPRRRGYQFGPALFPDGHALVYSSPHGNGIYHLYRINLDGTGERQLTFGAHEERAPAVSPDGRFIVFTSPRSGNGNLYRVNADGSGLTRLTTTTHPAFDAFPAISPDGRWIAFTSNRGGKDDIYLMDIHGRHPRRLTHETGDVYHPAFSPDGKRIAYTVWGDDHAYADVCVINLDGRGRKVLTNNWFRHAVRQRLGNNKVSQFLGLTGEFYDHSPAWAPAE